jgi:prophage regulatory protein
LGLKAMKTASIRPQRVLLQPEIQQVTGLKRTQIAKLERVGKFPRHVKLGIRRKGWLEHEIAAWQQARIAERDNGG